MGRVGWTVTSAFLMLGIGACDRRRTVRTIVRSGDVTAISEQCVVASLDATGRWRLQREPEGGMSVRSTREGRPSRLRLSLDYDERQSVISIDAAITTGMPDEQKTLKEVEEAERSVAEAIVRGCASRGVISCWDSPKRTEAPQCFP
jgi:hypothetical protein